jgi:hypothetical protein
MRAKSSALDAARSAPRPGPADTAVAAGAAHSVRQSPGVQSIGLTDNTRERS